MLYFNKITYSANLSNIDIGAGYGTAKASKSKDRSMKSMIPIVMCGVLAIYGLIIAVILVQKSKFLSITSFIYLILSNSN